MRLRRALFVFSVFFGNSLFAGPVSSPALPLVLAPPDSPAPQEEQPYTKVFTSGAYFHFPNQDSSRDGELRWVEPTDPDQRLLYGRGEILPLKPKQRARAFELTRWLLQTGVDSPEEVPVLIPFPREPAEVTAKGYRTAAQFSTRLGGYVLATWAGVRVELDRDNKPKNADLIFRYVEPRSNDGHAYIHLNFNTSTLPVVPFPEIDLNNEATCRFGLDLGAGPKAVRILGFPSDTRFLHVAFEQHAQQARHKPGYLSLYKVPVGNLRVLSPDTFEKQQYQFQEWTNSEITAEELGLLHHLRDPNVIPVSVNPSISINAFHASLVRGAHASLRSFSQRYSIYSRIESLRNGVVRCHEILANAPSSLKNGILNFIRRRPKGE